MKHKLPIIYIWVIIITPIIGFATGKLLDINNKTTQMCVVYYLIGMAGIVLAAICEARKARKSGDKKMKG